MGVRFRRSLRLAPGLRLNLSGRGLGLSIGMRGASISVGPTGTWGYASVPGTGLYTRKKLGGEARREVAPGDGATASPETRLSARIREDGRLELLDERGAVVPPPTARRLRRELRPALRQLLEEEAARINATREAWLSVHEGTPAPGEATFVESRFPHPKPPEARLEEPRLLDRLLPWRARRLAEQNRERQESAVRALEAWQREKAAFDGEQACLRQLYEEGRHESVEAMQELLAMRLRAIPWPGETLVSFEIEEEGSVVWLDVDMPEIEDFPRRSARPAKRAYRLVFREASATAQRKDYARSVHGRIVRLVGEVFAVLPRTTRVVASGFTQRVDGATGRSEDAYILSVSVDRASWRRLDLRRMERIDPLRCLETFALRRSMTKSGILRPVVPFGSPEAP